MSKAEELLASLTEEVPVHEHPVTDSDTYFIINPATRKIENTASRKNVLMQFDHKSEVFTFEIPRYVEGHDMMLCNKVYVHWNNIDAKTGEETADAYWMEDLQVNPEKKDTVICTWTPTRNSTQRVGMLSFLVQYTCVDKNGNVTYEWHTDFYEDMMIRKGRKNTEAAIATYTDILEQWYARLFGIGDSVLADISQTLSAAQQTLQEESASQQSAIEAKGAETLASIPPDYTEMYKMAEEAMRTKADAIVVDAEGEYISVTNASDDPLQSLRIFGRTTQAADPSPENPQELVGIENPEMLIRGKNVWDHSYDNVDLSNIEGWGNQVWSNPAVLKLLKPDTTYTLSFDVTCLSIPEYETFFSGHCGFVLYSSAPGAIPTVMARDEGPIFTVGEKRHVQATFTTPSDVLNSGMNYEVLRYTQRFLKSDGNAVFATVRFDNMLLEENDVATEFEEFTKQTLSIKHTLNSITDRYGKVYRDEIVYDYLNDKWQFIQRIKRYVHGETPCSTSAHDNGMPYHVVKVYDAVDSSPISCDRYLSTLWSDQNGYVYMVGDNIVFVDERFTDHVIAESILEEEKPEVLYVLATPIVHDLATEEILAFKALRTNKPNTVIQNGVGAYMIAEYNADTEIFLRECQPKPTDTQVENAVNTYFNTNGVQIPSDDHIRSLIDEALGGIVNGEY